MGCSPILRWEESRLNISSRREHRQSFIGKGTIVIGVRRGHSNNFSDTIRKACVVTKYKVRADPHGQMDMESNSHSTRIETVSRSARCDPPPQMGRVYRVCMSVRILASLLNSQTSRSSRVTFSSSTKSFYSLVLAQGRYNSLLIKPNALDKYAH